MELVEGHDAAWIRADPMDPAALLHREHALGVAEQDLIRRERQARRDAAKSADRSLGHDGGGVAERAVVLTLAKVDDTPHEGVPLADEKLLVHLLKIVLKLVKLQALKEAGALRRGLAIAFVLVVKLGHYCLGHAIEGACENRARGRGCRSARRLRLMLGLAAGQALARRNCARRRFMYMEITVSRSGAGFRWLWAAAGSSGAPVRHQCSNKLRSLQRHQVHDPTAFELDSLAAPAGQAPSVSPNRFGSLPPARSNFASRRLFMIAISHSFSRFAPAFILCCLGSSCERTAEGLKQDTQSLATSASEKGTAAERDLEEEVSAFRAEAEAKLKELSESMEKLEAKAERGLDESKQELARQIDETKGELGQLKAKSRSEWEETKRKLNARLAGFGEKVNATFDEVGDELDEAGEHLERKLE